MIILFKNIFRRISTKKILFFPSVGNGRLLQISPFLFFIKLKSIAIDIINKKLSPCTHIINDVKSFYLWNNNVVDDNENLLLIKCKQSDINEIEKIIDTKHNYAVPEIISHEFNIISNKYKKRN